MQMSALHVFSLVDMTSSSESSAQIWLCTTFLEQKMWHIRDPMAWKSGVATEILTEIECLIDFPNSWVSLLLIFLQMHWMANMSMCTQTHTQAQLWGTLQSNSELSPTQPSYPFFCTRPQKAEYMGYVYCKSSQISNQQNFSVCSFNHLNFILLIVPYGFSMPFWNAYFNHWNLYWNYVL